MPEQEQENQVGVAVASSADGARAASSCRENVADDDESENVDLSEYEEGDFEDEYLKLADDHIDVMTGMWGLDLSRSESADELMSALGIGMLKRRVMKTAKTHLQIGKLCVDHETGRKGISMTSLLPMGVKKTGTIFIDGEPFTGKDSDTGNWNVRAVVHKGRLIQRRESAKGVMYDVRATLNMDLKGKAGKFHVFKWTFINKSGKKYSCHRWFGSE